MYIIYVAYLITVLQQEVRPNSCISFPLRCETYYLSLVIQILMIHVARTLMLW